MGLRRVVAPARVLANALDQTEHSTDEKFPRVCWRTRGNRKIGWLTQFWVKAYVTSTSKPCRGGGPTFPASRSRVKKKARLAVLPNRARILATNKPARIPQVGGVKTFFLSIRPLFWLEAREFWLEARRDPCVGWGSHVMTQRWFCGHMAAKPWRHGRRPSIFRLQPRRREWLANRRLSRRGCPFPTSRLEEPAAVRVDKCACPTACGAQADGR